MSNPKSEHNQPIADPVAHFKGIPWCAKLLSRKDVVATQVPDRTPIASTESALVRETLNTPSTVRACVTFLRYIPPTASSKENGETKAKPFLEMVALLDLKQGINGFAGTAHGGFCAVVLDEVMGTVGNMQAEHGAYTAYLNVKYKKPVFTPAVVVCRGKVTKVDGRKVYLMGSFEDEKGEVLTEAEGLWIKMEKGIGRSNVRMDSKL